MEGGSGALRAWWRCSTCVVVVGRGDPRRHVVITADPQLVQRRLPSWCGGGSPALARRGGKTRAVGGGGGGGFDTLSCSHLGSGNTGKEEATVAVAPTPTQRASRRQRRRGEEARRQRRCVERGGGRVPERAERSGGERHEEGGRSVRRVKGGGGGGAPLLAHGRAEGGSGNRRAVAVAI